MEFLRSEGIVDEHRLAHHLDLEKAEVRRLLTHLVENGFIRTITRKGADCRKCPGRLSCPGSQVHGENPMKPFKAYQLTAAGMRYHRTLREEKTP